MNPVMSRPHAAPLLALTLVAAPFLTGCGEDESLATTPIVAVRGAPIDGSGDAGFVAPEPVEVAALDPAEDAAAEAARPDANATPSDAGAERVAGPDGAATDSTDATDATAQVASADADAATDESATDVTDSAGAAETAETADAPAPPEPDDDGIYHLSFRHLSLEGEDIDNIIDFLLFPEEFGEGEGFTFPDHIKALDDKPITISGYMIPGRIRNNKVRDFMLVRDLAGCCFGGAPNPDEWIDVVMTGEAEAEYLRYLPISVHGTLKLIGEQDQEGYAVGVYRMEATWAGEAD